MTPEEIARKIQDYREKALANFPLKLFETTGDHAFSKWNELKTERHGTPVVLGGDEHGNFDNLLTPFGPNGPSLSPPQPVDEILRNAAGVSFPQDLTKHKEAERERLLALFKSEIAATPDVLLPRITETAKNGKSRTYTREETIRAIEGPPRDPPLGDWPTAPEAEPGLSVACDLNARPLPKVYVGLAPTSDWTTIPAYLRWGGWNDCPPPEFHVAAMRSWRDRYGVELVGISSDTINLRVAKRPKTRDDAIALAREQYLYCADIVDQGVQTISALAAALMANDWWYFWWD